MKLFPTMTTYGKWISISNPSYPDGCELLTADEFAEQSEHIALSTGLDAEGQPEGCYVNHTEGFGGRFTGV